MTQEAWAGARNLLCVRLDTIGDVLMTTPAMRALRQSGPQGRRLTLLTSPPGAAVAPLVPEIDDVVTYEAPWLKASRPSGPAELEKMAAELADRAFDAAVIFTSYSQSPLPTAMLLHLAGIPLRLAYCRENPYQLLTDWQRDPDRDPGEGVRHEVRRQLDLVAAIGARTENERLSLRVPREAAATFEARLHDSNLEYGHIASAGGWVVVHPGATAPSRRYSPIHFAEVVARLSRELGLRVVMTGLAAERPLVDEIRQLAGVDVVSLAGELSLPELAALLERAPLLISNNSGPVHMAAALGTPVVDLYALTNPQHTPWKTPSRVLFHDVPCRNCLKSVCPMVHHACLELVEPAEVVAAAADLLARPPSPDRRGVPTLPIGQLA